MVLGGERFADEGDGGFQVAADERCWDVDHAIARTLKDAIPVRVEASAAQMHAVIHLDDEARLGAHEVGDVAVDGNLAPKGHTETANTQC
ncbi:MAG TPA: hypothetical protein VMG12_09930 [Polyangiaceae bacterium]|nr:hypothetical protein [Polyangiaceae bacterium]